MASSKKTKTKIKDATAPFQSHGVIFHSESGNQRIGECPFCEARTKFYVNKENGLWQCKSGACSLEGNIEDFLEYYWRACWEKTTVKDLSICENLRKKTVSASFLKKCGVANDGARFLIPVRSRNGRMCDLRIYEGGFVRSTAGVKLGLFGIERISKLRTGGVVIVCEGEFDCLALWEFLAKNGLSKKYAVCAVPGASVFKEDWADAMRGREIWLCYDADTAGQKGCDRAVQTLASRGCHIKRLQWPVKVEKGYDVSDWLRDYRKTLSKSPRRAWSAFKNLLTEASSGGHASENASENLRVFALANPKRKISYSTLMNCFRDWIHTTKDIEDAIRTVLAVTLSNWLRGDPVWLFLVGPAGACKSEILMSLSGLKQVVAVSSLSPRSLVSGFQPRDGHDPSLLAQINNMVMVVKDWTEILGLHSAAQEEIYAVMRGAYDGYVERAFGNGVIRKYQTHFTVLAGCTPAIYGSRQASLGDRFLKFHMQKGVAFDCSSAIKAAISNLNQESKMRETLREKVAAFFLNFGDSIEKIKLPSLPREFSERLVAISQLAGMSRGEVERDWRGEHIRYRAQHEIATRLAKQLSKVLISLGLLRTSGKKVKIEEDDYRIVERIALDTAYGFQLDVLLTLGKQKKSMSFQEIQEQTQIASTTLGRVLSDCQLLGIVKRTGQRREYGYEVNDYCRKLIQVSKLEDRLIQEKREQLRLQKTKGE